MIPADNGEGDTIVRGHTRAELAQTKSPLNMDNHGQNATDNEVLETSVPYEFPGNMEAVEGGEDSSSGGNIRANTGTEVRILRVFHGS